jgi:hypothetical protein
MDVDDLYGAPLEQFVAERGALARELRKQGKRDEAAEVAALRKPSVTAWAVNQLVRTQPRSLAELFDAGDALQEAHRSAAAGRGGGEALREASQRERAAVDALVDAARGLLTDDGHELSAAVVDRVADTLRAAALDDVARAQVRDGRLTRELRHIGLGVLSPAAAGAASASPPTGKGKRAATKSGAAASEPAGGRRRQRTEEERPKQRADEQRAEEERRELRAEEERRKREREQARSSARKAESSARRRAERAARALKLARQRRDRAAEELDGAERSLADAQADAEEAAAALERAEEERRSI